MTLRPVFLSYARDTSADHARAVHAALAERDITAFLDENDMGAGDRLPPALIDALLGAQVVVVFADEAYFTRWYCLWEWRVARTPFLAVAERHDTDAAEREAALAGLVLALPEGRPTALGRFPPLLRDTIWPAATDPDAVAALVTERLDGGLPTLAGRLDALPETGRADRARAELEAAVRLPPPLAARGVPLVPRALPVSLGERFVGRDDDLWRIDDLLVTRLGGVPGAAALTGALQGGGGIGKTRLALEYVHRLGPQRFPGGTFWIQADQEWPLVEDRHHEILRTLDRARDVETPPLAVYRDPASGRRLADDLIDAVAALPADRRALVVIDNVPEPPPGEPPPALETWWPARNYTAVLATSRLDVEHAEGGAVAGLPLDVLDSASARRLLTVGVADVARLTDAEWDEVTAWVGNLPLVLTLLSAMLRTGAIRPEPLLAQARGGSNPVDAADSAADALRGSIRADLLRPASDALRLSYDRLAPATQRAARLLAQLAPGPIPEALIDALGAAFPPATRLALVTRSLVTPLPPTTPPMFGTVHRVLAAFLRGRPTPDDGQEAELVAALDALLAVMKADDCRDPARWPVLTVCWPHAETVARRCATHPDEGVVARAVDLANRGGSLLHAQGAYAAAGAVCAEALRLAHARLGTEHGSTLSSMLWVAYVFYAQGDLAGARTLQEQGLAACTRLLGAGHPDTLTSAHNLAETLRAQGDLAGARTLQDQVLAARTRLFGAEHSDTLASAHNLASALYAQGDLAGTRTLLERVLAAHTRLLGAEHPDTLTSGHNLAETLRAQGDLAGARTLQERVLTARTRRLGAEHPDTLRSMGNLAVSYWQAGELPAAERLERAVLLGRERVLGPAHPDTLYAMENLAATLRDRGDLAGARALRERRLELIRREHGPAAPETLSATLALAELLVALDDRAEAMRLLTQARTDAATAGDLPDELCYRLDAALAALGSVNE